MNPLIVTADYLSPGITRMMIEKGPMACFMRDKKGYLPIHVACTRHCSPEKLDMLLAVNPVSLVDRTAEGFTILELAMANKTASHPNQALIEDIERRMKEANIDMSHFEVAIPATPMDYTSYEYRGLTQSQYLLRNRLDSNDSARVSDSSEETHAGIQMDYIDHATQTNLDATDTLAMMTVSNRDRHYQDRERKHQSKISMGPIRKRKVCVSDNSGSHNVRDTTVYTASTPATVKQEETSCKPTIGTTENSPAHLLLHFSQNVSSPTSGSSHEYGPSHKPQELLEDMTTG